MSALSRNRESIVMSHRRHRVALPRRTSRQTTPRRAPARQRRSLVATLLTALMTLGLLLPVVGFSAPARATPGDIGHLDQAYNGSGGAPTADKPQSKLWYNDGLWWADMFDKTSKTWHIFRLDRATETWVDTGTQIDNRAATHADTLWSGGHLYVASHVKAASSEASVANQPARLYRYSYDAATKTYTLDAGFPVQLNNNSSESLTLDRDSHGVLWVTWTQADQVWVNSSTTSDAAWGTPFVLPVTGATGLEPDDITALAAFGTNRVGLFWSNQVTSTFYFAVHRDGDASTTWTGKVALSSHKIADDHINLKQLEADPAGHVYAAVKTSLDETGVQTAPQIELVALDTATGKWGAYVYGTVADCQTRPQIVIDSTNRVLHMFSTAPSAAGCPYSGSSGAIYEKTSPLDNISFPAGRGTPVIRDAASDNLNNVTSTKQNVTASSGLVILASNDATSHYWHADIALRPAAPVASFAESPSSGTAPLQVAFTDTSSCCATSWSWDFGDGGTSDAQNPVHTFTSAGTYSVTLTVTGVGGSSSTSRTVDVAPAGAGITFGGSTTAGSVSSSAVTLAEPTGTTAGDVLVASFTVTRRPAIKVPPGWTALLAKPLTPNNGVSVVAYYRVVTSADAGTTDWTWSLSAAQKWAGGISGYRGVSTTRPIDTTVSTAVDNSVTATGINVPAVTTQTADAMLIGGMGADGANLPVTQPTGWTEGWETATKLAEQAYTWQATPGSSGSATWSISSGRAIAGWMTALRAAS